MEKILEVKNLKKYYKDSKAVDGLDFELYKGEILGLLGPNGAGKSTTINMLSTLLKEDDGEIIYFNKSLNTNRKYVRGQLGIVPQDLAIFEELSAYKNVEFFTSLYGISGKELKERVEEALKFVALFDVKDNKPKTFSGGMKRRLNIACAIAHNPKILIMDEPTVGIDPQSRNHILESIKKLRDSGTTIIYTTHYMEEVEEVADRIVIMDKGKKIAEGTKEQLKEEFKDKMVYKIYCDEALNKDFNSLYSVEGVQKVVEKEGFIEVNTLKVVENLDKIILKLIELGIKIKHITSEEGNLEMIFLALTGKNLRD
ncbi:MAG: ABC transporter ATP-binding protein [Clostridiaceae bacterium]